MDKCTGNGHVRHHYKPNSQPLLLPHSSNSSVPSIRYNRSRLTITRPQPRVLEAPGKVCSRANVDRNRGWTLPSPVEAACWVASVSSPQNPQQNEAGTGADD